MRMDRKQTSMIFLIGIAFLFLAYQIYRMVSGDMMMSQQASAIVYANKFVPNGDAAKQDALHRAELNAKVTLNSSNIQSRKKSPSKAQAATTSVPQAAKFNSKGSTLASDQKQYIKLVNSYELAKMKRQLLNEQESIAEAQQHIVKLHKQTQVLGGPVDSSSAGSNTTSTFYRLTFVGKEDGQWNATLVSDGHYSQVSVGTLLPNGSKVIAVSNRGVTLEKNKRHQLVTFNGTVDLNAAATGAAVKRSEVKVVATKPTAIKWKRESVFSLNAGADDKSLIVKKSDASLVVNDGGNAGGGLTAIDYTAQERSILERSGSHYTIQLIGSYDPAVIRDFVAKNNLGSSAKEFYVVSEGKPWFMLIRGDYPSEKAALHAMQQLPESMASQHPWLREYDDVQESIVTRR